MKKITLAITAIAALSSSIVAADYILPVKTADLSKLTASSKEIGKLKFESVTLYPQTTVRGNDAEANKKFDGAKALKAEVAVLANEHEMSVVIRWTDSTNSKQIMKSTKAFADSVALQIPQNCSEADKLPYIGMGSEGRPVEIMLQKNVEGYYPVSENPDVQAMQVRQNLNMFNDELKKHEEAIAKSANTKYQKVFVAEGFRSTTEIKENLAYKMDMSYANGMWTAVFTKPIKDEYSAMCDALPVALAIWDGAKDGRNGIKWLSSWTPIKMKDSEKSKTAIKVMSEKVKGNVANGKTLALSNCGACHTMGDNKAAVGMAPDLSNIGGYSTAAYLRESMTNPSAVVVSGLNVNQRPGMQFYSVDAEGKRVSNMPSFDFLKPAEIDDIAAYLQTLKAGGMK
jgi:mono/diheme cytochrome c family protein